MKVLVLVHNLRTANGVASFVMNYFKKINHKKIHMDLAVYEKLPSPNYEIIEKVRGKVFILPNVKNPFEHIKMCYRILENGKYDVIHNNTFLNSIPMMWCAKSVGVPVRILHSHNSKLGETFIRQERNKILLPLLRSAATDYTACSNLAGHAMFETDNFTVIPNVVSSDRYCFEQLKRNVIKNCMNAKDKYIVGTVGRLAIQKNPFFAIDVFEKLLEINPLAEYWWIGNGGLDDEVAEYIKKKGLMNSVKLLGSRDDVVDLYQAMDCFFLPSLFEGLPVTGIEAQAMGLPMVVSDTVTDEMVYTDLVDYVSLDEPPEVWAEHLAKALHRKISREEYTEQLKRSIFSDNGCGERLLEIYEQMIYGKGNRRTI